MHNRTRRQTVEHSELEYPPHRSLVFVMGDLNYRVQVQPRAAIDLIADACQENKEGPARWEHLMAHDELKQAMALREAFPGFHEPADVDFAPTYCYNPTVTVE